jgi:hypothetical protein
LKSIEERVSIYKSDAS